MDFSLNNIVVKTYPGMANAVAARIDSLRESDIIGSVAGDDCIIMVARSSEAAEELANKFREMIGA